MGLANELKSLQDLHEKGQLTDQEYADAKAMVLKGPASSPQASEAVSGKKVEAKKSPALIIGAVVILMIILASWYSEKTTPSPAIDARPVQRPAVLVVLKADSGNPEEDLGARDYLDATGRESLPGAVAGLNAICSEFHFYPSVSKPDYEVFFLVRNIDEIGLNVSEKEEGRDKEIGFRMAKSIDSAYFTACGVLREQAAPPPAPATAAAQAGKRQPGLYLTFQTDKGSIVCQLYEKEAPLTVRTMVGLAIGKVSYIDPQTGQTTKKKFFDGLTFHRVIPGLMIQGGDSLGTGAGSPGGPGFPYKNEAVPTLEFDVPGRLAMANAGPNTNGSQFFVTEAPVPSFNGGYTIWGQCGNADVVKAIARVQRDSNDKPLAPVHIEHVIVERVGPAPADAPES